jgi:hypothetical protein
MALTSDSRAAFGKCPAGCDAENAEQEERGQPDSEIHLCHSWARRWRMNRSNSPPKKTDRMQEFFQNQDGF